MSGVSHTGSSGVHGAQQLFQLEQYDRCAALVEQLLLSEAQTGLLDKCTLLHLLAMSLLRTGHLTRAKEVLQRLGEALTQCEELTHDEREAWRACYLADKGEMLECEGHLLEAERAFTDASLIQAVVGYNYYDAAAAADSESPLLSRPLLRAAAFKARSGLWEDARCLISCARQLLLPRLAGGATSPVMFCHRASREPSRAREERRSFAGDRRADLRCMESALEALMQCRPFTEAERQLLLKGVGCVALEYAEMLLREGAAVKTVLRRTAEHLCLATEAMEQYLCHLPESLPAFAQAQLKLVRLLLILGVEHPRPAVGENPFLEHAIHMVEELLAEISLLSPSGGTENDAALQRAWRWTRARLTSQVLEAHGDILTAQGRHRAAALCLTRSLDEYGTAVSTYYGGGNDDDDGRNADTRLKESVDVVRLRLRVKYAEALTRSGDYVKSVQLLQRLRAEVTPSSGGVPPDTIATVMQALGNALTACHRLQEAQQCYEDVVECLEAGDDDVFRSAAMDRLADIALCCGKVSEAVVYFRHALRLRRRTLGDCHLDTAASHRNLSEALFLHARYTEAEEHADACMRIVMHLYTGATARHLHDDLAGSPERVGRIASGGGLLGVACAHRSPYVQHPLYAAAARRKSECIQLRKKARILGS